MDSKSNYTIVGGIVLFFLGGLILTGVWLSVGFQKKHYSTFAVYMNEPVFGLSIEAPVKFNGVGVGYVSRIALNKANPQQVLLLLDVEDKAPITTSTTAVLQSQGITGIRYVELKAGSQYAEPLKKIPGETYPIIPSRPSLLVQLDTALKDLTVNFQLVADAVNTVLDKDNATALKNTLRNIENVSTVVSLQSKEVGEAIDSAATFLKNTATASEKFPVVLDNISSGSLALRNMADNVRVAGGKVSTAMQAGQNTMQQFSEQTIPQMTRLMEKMQIIANQVNGLTKELKNNPSMIVRGKEPRQLGPGEK